MANYTGLGEGFAAGVNAGNYAIANRQSINARLLEQRRQQEFEHNQKALDLNVTTLQNAYKFAAEQGQAAIQGGADRARVVAEMAKVIEATNSNADRVSKMFPDFDANAFKSQGDLILKSLSVTPTATEAAKSKAKADVAGQTERVSALTEAGVPAEAAVRAIPEVQKTMDSAEKARETAVKERQAALDEAKFAFEKQQPNSPIGKLVGDYLTFEKILPPDSPGLQAIKDTMVGAAMGEKPSFENVRGLRQEFTKASGNTLSLAAAYSKVKSSYSRTGPAADVSMIYAYMKMLDPTSAVLSGEQATAEKARNVPEDIRALYNKLVVGGQLTAPQRADFMAQATSLMAMSIRNQKKIDSEFKRLAEQQNIDPRNVVWDATLGAMDDSKEGPEKIGAMPDGRSIYRRADGSTYIE